MDLGYEPAFHEFTDEGDCISVIIKCSSEHPGNLEDIGSGHPLFDFARQILEGRLVEKKWVTVSGHPNDCDLDLRTMVGEKDGHYYFCLACLKMPKGTLDNEWEPVHGQDFQNGNVPDVEPCEMEHEKGVHTLEDLLGEMDDGAISE